MKFENWKKFIHTTTSYHVDTIIECGSVCNSHFDQCDLFVYHKVIHRCHVGKFDSDYGYLDGYSGEFPVHLSMSMCLFRAIFDLSNKIALLVLPRMYALYVK